MAVLPLRWKYYIRTAGIKSPGMDTRPRGEGAGLKPPAQFMEALRTGARESDSSDFHELRQEFIPPNSPIYCPRKTCLIFISSPQTSIIKSPPRLPM